MLKLAVQKLTKISNLMIIWNLIITLFVFEVWAAKM